MRTVTAVVAVLAMASMAHAVALSVGPTAPVAAGTPLDIPILISGGETNIQAITANISVPSGGILDYNAKSGVLGGSTNTQDPPYIFDNADGNAVAPGAPNASGVYADFSMNFGAFATADGVAGTLSVDTTGLAPGVYPVSLSSLFGASLVGGAEVPLQDGSFEILPEPATMLLLGLGGLFLRRRTA